MTIRQHRCPLPLPLRGARCPRSITAPHVSQVPRLIEGVTISMPVVLRCGRCLFTTILAMSGPSNPATGASSPPSWQCPARPILLGCGPTTVRHCRSITVRHCRRITPKAGAKSSWSAAAMRFRPRCASGARLPLWERASRVCGRRWADAAHHQERRATAAGVLVRWRLSGVKPPAAHAPAPQPLQRGAACSTCTCHPTCACKSCWQPTAATLPDCKPGSHRCAACMLCGEGAQPVAVPHDMRGHNRHPLSWLLGDAAVGGLAGDTVSSSDTCCADAAALVCRPHQRQNVPDDQCHTCVAADEVDGDGDPSLHGPDVLGTLQPGGLPTCPHAPPLGERARHGAAQHLCRDGPALSTAHGCVPPPFTHTAWRRAGS
jgi:hypothetical protein